jgi:hypothetical protein
MSVTNKQIRKEAELEKARREKEHRDFKEAQVQPPAVACTTANCAELPYNLGK